MNFCRLTVAATLLAALGGSRARGQQPAEQPQSTPQSPEGVTSSASGITLARAAAGGQAPSERADAYYNFTMGHVYEQQYENTSKPEYATQAIDFYKKAYALDPKSPVIGERLAEMYWKAQRDHDAVTEAQEILKRDPNDVPTRRLLGAHLSSQPRRFERQRRPIGDRRARHRTVQGNLPAGAHRHGIRAVARAALPPAQRARQSRRSSARHLERRSRKRARRRAAHAAPARRRQIRRKPFRCSKE